MELFGQDRVAQGYAGSRPRFHPPVIEKIRSTLGIRTRLARALDVGCGTGLSTVPLLELAERAISAEEARRSGLALRHAEDYTLEWPFKLREFVESMMTQSNTTAAVRQGRESADGIGTWLSASLEELFAGVVQRMMFGGYIWYLQRSP